VKKYRVYFFDGDRIDTIVIKGRSQIEVMNKFYVKVRLPKESLLAVMPSI
jgi:hypothetical protein